MPDSVGTCVGKTIFQSTYNKGFSRKTKYVHSLCILFAVFGKKDNACGKDFLFTGISECFAIALRL